MRSHISQDGVQKPLSDNPFDAKAWRPVDGFSDLTDITYHRHVEDATVRVAFDRPEVRNAFRPDTVDELYRVLDHARMSPDVGAVLLTGNGPSPKDGGWAFCAGGDQRIRGRSGYQYASGETADTIDAARAGRLHILEVQRLIRFMPKVVICLVNGWAAGGGHSLHVVCDLTLASREHARFKQTDADVGSFDGSYGSAYLARQVGQKFAREIFSWAGLTPPSGCIAWARSTRSSTTPSWRPWACSGRPRSTRNRLRRNGC